MTVINILNINGDTIYKFINYNNNEFINNKKLHQNLYENFFM